MSYVTQGTIQVELKTGAKTITEIAISINPAQDYTVTHEKNAKKREYIIFIDDQFNEAKIFEKTRVFTTDQTEFLQYLIGAAFKQIRMEIRIKDPKPRKASSSRTPVKIEIESVKIPAAS
jgi:hypothetical protein